MADIGFDLYEVALPTIRHAHSDAANGIRVAMGILLVGNSAVFDPEPWSGRRKMTPIQGFYRTAFAIRRKSYPARRYRTSTLPDGRLQLERTA
jgi:hypothetical protein